MNFRRIGIFGESECGKTTLAKRLAAEFYRQYKIPSLVFDPQRSRWPSCCWTTSVQETFQSAVQAKRGFLVIIEDASQTIQRDREFTPFFTAIRHQCHHLMVMGHDATDLLRVMRQNLNELYLFVQTPAAVELWQDSQPSMKGLEASADLQKFEFIHCLKFSTARRCSLAL